MSDSGLEGPQDWSDPAFVAAALAWVDERLAENGLARAGDTAQDHLPWWATAIRVPTTDGVVWFKACRPTFATEVAILPMLQRLRPELLARTVASDPALGWLLTWDSGPKLREHAPGWAQLPYWERILPAYAELQQSATDLVPELLAAGTPDHRTAVLAGQAARLAADGELLTGAVEEALTEAELAAVRSTGLAELDRLCAALAARGVPDTVQHDDLHDGNVLVEVDGGSGPGVGDRPVVFDWGDACVAHPFHTLVVTLRSIAYRIGVPPGSPELLRLRDAYLEPWGSYGTRAELVETADLARRTGTVQRAVAWWRFVRAMPSWLAPECAASVPYGLRMFMADRPWGAYEPA